MIDKDLCIYRFNDGQEIEFRLCSEGDSLKELTELLNKSYKSLSDMGFNYLAARQDENITLERVKGAYKSYIGIYRDRIVSTISLYSPTPSDRSQWYNKDFVAKVGQFAVLPKLQKSGIGNRMMDIVEREARSIKGVKEIALDTAETAHHLIEFYKKRGYRKVETISWDVTNYNSVVLSKSLDT